MSPFQEVKEQFIKNYPKVLYSNTQEGFEKCIKIVKSGKVFDVFVIDICKIDVYRIREIEDNVNSFILCGNSEKQLKDIYKSLTNKRKYISI